MTFTDHLAKSMTFEEIQNQSNFYLEHGGRVMKLFPGFEPYIFESISSQCSMRGINPDDLSLILPISGHEIRSGMYPKSHPTHPHFFSKQDKIAYIREHCPTYVPHRRGLFVMKIIQQMTTKLDGLNIDNTLNLPVEKLYDDYPSNYDPRQGGFVSSSAHNPSLIHNGDNTTTIKLHDLGDIDPMDYLATQELPDNHVFKRSNYDHSKPIHLPSGRYPADRLRDKVYQVTSHLGSEAVDLVVLNELEHIHQEHMTNAYETVLESFFQCELLVMEGKTRGYGLSSRLISTHHNHDHYLSPYKLILMGNFCAELARLYKGLPTKDPYFHPSQVRLLMDICTGAVLPPKSVVDDLYGEFKDDFMAKFAKKSTKTQQSQPTSHNRTQSTTPETASATTKSLDDVYTQLKKNMQLQGIGVQNGDVPENDNQNGQQTNHKNKKMDKFSDYFGASLRPMTLNEQNIDTSSKPFDSFYNSGGNGVNNGDKMKKAKKDSPSLSLATLFQAKRTQPNNQSSPMGDNDSILNGEGSAGSPFDQSGVPLDVNSFEYQSLTTQQKLIKRQFESLDQQLGIVLEAKRLTMLANGSTAEDRLRLEERQQILVDNNMLLTSDLDSITTQNIDKLYTRSSPYTLIDNPDGERGKYKDLLAAKRVLAMKGEGLSEGEIKKLEQAKGKLKQLLSSQGEEGVSKLIDNKSLEILSQDGLNSMMNEDPEAAVGGNKLKHELFRLQEDEAIDKLLQQQLKLSLNQIDQENDPTTTKHSQHSDDDVSNGGDVKTVLDMMYDDELFVLDELYDEQQAVVEVEADPSNPFTSTETQLTTTSGHTIAAKPLKPIAPERVEELLNPQHKMTAQEQHHFEQLRKQQENDKHNAEQNREIFDTNTTYSATLNTMMSSSNASPKGCGDDVAIQHKDGAPSPLALMTNFKNYKYYNPYAIISKDKLRSEMLELQLMQSLQKLLPNDDVKALVKGATQYFEKVQQEITVLSAKRLAIYKLDHFFEQSLLFRTHYLKNYAQRGDKSSNDELNLSKMEKLMLDVKPKVIKNWEQWKKGERKRQFQLEVSMALEREYGNLFQNIIYKTIVNNNPTFLDQVNEKNGSGGADGVNTGPIDMPKLKLGQLFKSETFNQLYSVITNKKNKVKSVGDGNDGTEPSEQDKMKEMYDLLDAEQQQELQRIAMYIPVYTSTGILPLFPVNVIKKHHEFREDLIVTEMKRQLKVQGEFLEKEEANRKKHEPFEQNTPQEEEEEEETPSNRHQNNDDGDIPFDFDQSTPSDQPPRPRYNQSKAKSTHSPSNLFDPDYDRVIKSQGLLTQDLTWYNDDYVPLWMCNKRQSRLLLLEPEVNLSNFNFTTQRTHPVPTTKPQWKRYKSQQQGIGPLDREVDESERNKKLTEKEKISLYHLDTTNMTLLTPHQFAIEQGMLVSTMNTFDVTIDDKTIRLMDHPTVEPQQQQQLNEYLSHSLSFLRTIERSYPYQSRDSLAKNLPPVLSVSTAQLLQMELPFIVTVPELEEVLYHRLLPQIQGAVNVLQSHQEFEAFTSQLATAGEKTKSAAEACLLAYNTPIVSHAERALSNLNGNLKVLEAITVQLLWLSLGLGFDSVGIPTATTSGIVTTYLHHILMRESINEQPQRVTADSAGTLGSTAGDNLKQNFLATHDLSPHTSSNVIKHHINNVNNRDISQLEPLSRQEALQILHTAATTIIPVLKKKISDLSQHLKATPYSRHQAVALATSERLHLAQTKVREFHMIGGSGRGQGDGDGSTLLPHTSTTLKLDHNGNPVNEKMFETNPHYRHQVQELEISMGLKDLYRLNPFVPAERAFDEDLQITSQSQSQLLLLQYGNIHQLEHTKAAQH